MKSASSCVVVSCLFVFLLGGGCFSSISKEGDSCQTDLDCEGTLLCFYETCRLADCQQLDCPAGWACIDGLCCNQNRCCSVEGKDHPGTCENDLDDDCDGWTDELDTKCDGGCALDADCDDNDPCTIDSCRDRQCENTPRQGECCDPTGTFGVAQPYTGPEDPAFLNSADLDGDGALDLVVGSDDASSVVVLPNLGNGSFGSPLSFPAGSGPWVTALADFNSNGLTDIAAADFTGKVAILKNQTLAAGQFDFANAQLIDVGGTLLGIAAGDVNGDTDLDLIVADHGRNQLIILAGDGDGGFVVESTLPGAAEPVWVALGDLNADGRLDVVAANRTANTASVWLAQPDGSLGARADFDAGQGCTHLLINDFNRDGHNDIVSVNRYAHSVSLLRGNSDGSLAAPLAFTTEPNGEPRTAAAADFNSDGLLDLAVANFLTDSISVMFAVEGGGFASAVQYPVSGRPSGIVARDLNGDGFADLAASTSVTDKIEVLLADKVCY
ncbi:MAG: VCBS repeat-containing protein [Deltaproteobacteria bacterium]|nr:VCBS repeat-containing protein [Deltaproteobacteria bacterium]